MSVLSIEQTGSRLQLTLQRPEIHNALDDALIGALQRAVEDAAANRDVRAVIFAGAGRSFCAGADLNWMRAVVDATEEQNRADAERLTHLLDAMLACPKPIIGRVHGAALGGGMGLVAACDLVVAAPRAQFGLTEVRLGLAPAMIFPYLLRKVQPQHLLCAALTGERFRAEQAAQLGLVNRVSEDLDTVVDDWVAQLQRGGPEALGTVKQLFQQVPQLDWQQAREFTVQTIAKARASEEGQEGMRAFLQRRKPAWAPTED